MRRLGRPVGGLELHTPAAILPPRRRARRPLALAAGLRRGTALLLALALVATGTPAWASGDPLSHYDRARSLYRVVVTLDAGGNPVLPVAVIEHATSVAVEGSNGLRVLGTGDGAVEFRVPAGKSVEITGQDLRPAKKLFWVGLARAPSDDMDTLRSARKYWQDKGMSVKLLAVGATYALAGRVLDTRQTVLGLEPPFTDAEAAEKRAAALADGHGRDTFVHVVVDTPPSASLRLAAPGGVEVRAADVLWLEALPDDKGEALPLIVNARGSRLELPGRVYIAPGDGGGLAVVNEARIETMLEGVVASEIFQSAPLDALRAQAVAARTDMLAKVGLRHHADPFAICSEVHCQAYRGLGKVNPRISEAVRSTRGQVLVGSDGRLVDTFYHAVSGGHTENNENAWRMPAHPNLRGRADLTDGAADPLAKGADDASVRALLDGPDRSWAAASGKNKAACRWEVSHSASELESSLRAAGILKPIRSLRILERGVSGRILHVEVELSDGSKRKIWGELRIRRMFKGLRSSLALVAPGPTGADGVPRSWSFRGAGYGHGVGMDQTGAVGRASKGQTYKAILGHYYQGSRLEQLY